MGKSLETTVARGARHKKKGCLGGSWVKVVVQGKDMRVNFKSMITDIRRME
jgi:hypothetical protein